MSPLSSSPLLLYFPFFINFLRSYWFSIFIHSFCCLSFYLYSFLLFIYYNLVLYFSILTFLELNLFIFKPAHFYIHPSRAVMTPDFIIFISLDADVCFLALSLRIFCTSCWKQGMHIHICAFMYKHTGVGISLFIFSPSPSQPVCLLHHYIPVDPFCEACC